MLGPAPVGCAGDVFEGVVDGEYYLRGPSCVGERIRVCWLYCTMFPWRSLAEAWAPIYCVESVGAIKRVGLG